MKLKDYDANIEEFEERRKKVLKKLDTLDPASEEYTKAAENLKLVQESKEIEVSCKNDTWRSKIPQWGVTIFGSAVAVVFGFVVRRDEKNEGVISSQAVNIFDKVVRKF